MGASVETRTETAVLEIRPERKRTVVRRYEEFGWTLASAQEGTTMRGDRVTRVAKLLFTRTASPAWIDDMSHLEKELHAIDRTVQMGRDGLVRLGAPPRTSPPLPLVVLAAFASYLLGWFALDVTFGLLAGLLGGILLWALMRQKLRRRALLHRAARRKATEEFRKKRSEILVRVRAHANTRNTPPSHTSSVLTNS